MVYPFNVHIAQKVTASAKKETDNEKCVLVNAYLDIANVFITRSATRGGDSAWIYLPYEVRKDVTQLLEESGFTVEPIRNTLSHYRISWKED